MEFIGTLITYLMMACCVVGGISYIVNDQSELGRAFQDGLHAMANMFIPICGLMASVPFLKVFISKVFGPVFALFGGDPVVAAAIIMPPDCGSFALATEIGQSADLFPVIIAIGFMCASTIAFNVPIGLSMLDKGDHKYLALGTMSGFLSVPFGVFITSVIVMFTHPAIRSTFSSVGEPDHVVMLTLGMLLRNMIPLVVICVLLALGLKFFPNGMVKGFMVFGKLMTGALTLVVVACLPNGLAMFPFVKEMRPRDKVVCMAFLACGGYSLGDFLAFNVNFQPNLLVPVFVGQICGGIIGILFAKLLAVPQVRALERETAV